LGMAIWINVRKTTKLEVTIFGHKPTRTVNLRGFINSSPCMPVRCKNNLIKDPGVQFGVILFCLFLPMSTSFEPKSSWISKWATKIEIVVELFLSVTHLNTPVLFNDFEAWHYNPVVLHISF